MKATYAHSRKGFKAGSSGQGWMLMHLSRLVMQWSQPRRIPFERQTAHDAFPNGSVEFGFGLKWTKGQERNRGIEQIGEASSTHASCWTTAASVDLELGNSVSLGAPSICAALPCPRKTLVSSRELGGLELESGLGVGGRGSGSGVQVCAM